MTEQQYPDIKPGLRVQYRSHRTGTVYYATLAGEVREVDSVDDGMVAVIDPERPTLGVVNAEEEATFWEMYEPERSKRDQVVADLAALGQEMFAQPTPPTRQQLEDAVANSGGLGLMADADDVRQIVDAVEAVLNGGAR